MGQRKSEGDKLAGKIAASKPHLKIVPFIAVEESRPENVNHAEMHEMWKASIGLIDTYLILEKGGAAIQYEHCEEGGVPFSQPQKVLAVPREAVRARFAREYLRITQANAEIENILASNSFPSPHKADKLD